MSAGLSPQRLAEITAREERLTALPAELLEEITERQAAAVAAVEFPHRDPSWIPATGAMSARIVEAPDHPYFESLADLTLEQKAALPARFHVPVFDDCGVPNAWLCEVCWDEGTATGWPCATARKHGAEVFGQSREDVHRTRLESALAEAARLTRAVPPMTDQTRDERLAEITAREAAATKGPWGTYDDGTGHIDIAADLEGTGTGYRCRREVAQTVEEPIDNDPAHRDWDEDADLQQIEADAEFIAKAREDVPFLLAKVARLQARVAELETARCHAGALAEQRHQLLDPPEPPLCIAAAAPTAPAVAA